MPICWIGIGANLGDAHKTFDAAWSRLSLHAGIELLSRSGIYQTAPVGQAALHTVPMQAVTGKFSNAVFSLNSLLSPIELLDRLQQTETELGRQGNVRWGSRIVDLDLLFADDIVLNEPRLTLPHPGAWYRRFVIDPLNEIAPELVHPQFGKTVQQLLQVLQRRPMIVGVNADSPLLRPDAQKQLAEQSVELRLQNLDACRAIATAALRIDRSEPPGPLWKNLPVADLTNSPGDPVERVLDFTMAILDSPCRISDW